MNVGIGSHSSMISGGGVWVAAWWAGECGWCSIGVDGSCGDVGSSDGNGSYVGVVMTAVLERGWWHWRW